MASVASSRWTLHLRTLFGFCSCAAVAAAAATATGATGGEAEDGADDGDGAGRDAASTEGGGGTDADDRVSGDPHETAHFEHASAAASIEKEEDGNVEGNTGKENGAGGAATTTPKRG